MFEGGYNVHMPIRKLLGVIQSQRNVVAECINIHEMQAPKLL